MRPICPACDSPMTARYFVGYYEQFACWQCECEVIPDSTIKAGSFSYADDGVPYQEYYGAES